MNNAFQVALHASRLDLRRKKVRAVLAADDPLPALGVFGYLGSKLS